MNYQINKRNFLLYILIVALIIIAGCGEEETPRTLTPQEKTAIDAVQSQKTTLGSNMHESVGMAFVIIESEGHTMKVDGWYSGGIDTGKVSVKFYFYIDGKREYAEWIYYPDGIILPNNEWAFVFMGE